MPNVLRGSPALAYKDYNGFKYRIADICTKTIKDMVFKQVNLTDKLTFLLMIRWPTHRVSKPFLQATPKKPQFANVYEMSNTLQGYH